MSNHTKEQLSNCLKKMMSKTCMDHITVKDLVADCGINRQTFYYHFQDIYDLLGYIFRSEALESIVDYKTYDTWQLGFLKIFQYVENNRAFCLNTVNSLGRDHLEMFLNQQVFDLLLGVVNELAGELPIKEEEKHFIARFYTYGFVNLMLEWLKSGTKEEPKAIIDKLSKLVDGDISRAIDKYLNSKPKASLT